MISSLLRLQVAVGGEMNWADKKHNDHYRYLLVSVEPTFEIKSRFHVVKWHIAHKRLI